MAKINYSYDSIGERALRLTALSEGSAHSVHFTFLGIECGVLYIGGMKATIADGEAQLSLASLSDGIYHPTVITPVFCLRAEPFAKIDEKIYATVASGKEIIEIKNRISLLEKENNYLQNQIKELRERISSGCIFSLNERN